MILELVFPAFGTVVPVDHGYHLYSTISSIIPEFHQATSRLRFSLINGTPIPDGQLDLSQGSRFCVRCPEGAVKSVLPLAGKSLAIAGKTIRLGVPSIRTLIPATSLTARIVTFKNATTPDAFLTTTRLKLKEIQVNAEPSLPIHTTGDHAGEPQRKIIRIHGTAIVGYSLIVAELSAEDSLKLQERGLGGRTQMGCGFFVPFRPRES